ncbi:hypothetical protein KI688_007049 [Linnemannia hyalina]|uniref:Uncharacterized protein n=1 Tax=Linnemannia hyalina TaxID=64524 RepID=A0A9P8BN96_9FUNG|nr:hypothetical protein KI688_007049 [Linnemannia hyalina]
MRKVLFLITVVGLLASLVSAAPTCFNSNARKQEVFTHAGHREPHDDSGIIYLPPARSRRSSNLDTMMEELIRKEMTTTFRDSNYLESLMAKVCDVDASGDFIADCEIKILTEPKIRVIPTKSISKEIVCTTVTCHIGLEESVSVSTTNSLEVSMSITAGAKPFGVGMEFTVTTGYGFSNTVEESVSLSYGFDLVRGDSGYIGMVSAEVSAYVRVEGCRCNNFLCAIQCSSSGLKITEDGHHEAVILKDGTPRSYVSFVYTN